MKASFRIISLLRSAAAILLGCFAVPSCSHSPKVKTPAPVVVAARAPEPVISYLFKIAQIDQKSLSAAFQNRGAEPLSVPVDPAEALQVVTQDGRLLDLVTAQHREMVMAGSFARATKNVAPNETIQASISLNGRVDLLSGVPYVPQQGDKVKAAWNNNQRTFVSNEIKLKAR